MILVFKKEGKCLKISWQITSNESLRRSNSLHLAKLNDLDVLGIGLSLLALLSLLIGLVLLLLSNDRSEDVHEGRSKSHRSTHHGHLFALHVLSGLEGRESSAVDDGRSVRSEFWSLFFIGGGVSLLGSRRLFGAASRLLGCCARRCLFFGRCAWCCCLWSGLWSCLFLLTFDFYKKLFIITLKSPNFLN